MSGGKLGRVEVKGEPVATMPLLKNSTNVGVGGVSGETDGGGSGSGSTIDEKLNFKNVPQKFTEDTTCKYWYCR